MDTSLAETVRFARDRLARSGMSHDWEHTLRVRRLSLRIGEAEGADLKVVEIAAYLHDIARPLEDGSKGAVCHAQRGAEIAEGLLKGLPLPPNQSENILHCIRSHRFRGKVRPETVEAKALFDADKLDAIGAIGIARAFQFAGELGARLHNADVHPDATLPYSVEDTGYREFRLKLSKIRDRMQTREGRRLANGRHEFMEAFFKRFLDEHEGVL
jgi:uncharacterized protein